MRLLCVHAHFDDFEHTAGGLFSLVQRRLGDQVRTRLLVCTDGKAGHHFRTREETGRLRIQEQMASAAIGNFEVEVLRTPDGLVPRDGCLEVNTPTLAGLWKAIRDFEPDYLFCPPLPTENLAGVHNDHVAVAEAVRKVAYMINVPHAFTPEYPADETHAVACKVPVIVNLYDSYMFGENSYDMAVNISGVFDQICEMSYCHASQFREWLPWVGRHDLPAPQSLGDWKGIVRAYYAKQQRSIGVNKPGFYEFFTVTAWGVVPTLHQLLRDFPEIDPECSNLKPLQIRLERWLGM